ncbi:hypothetical protein ACFOET_11330 [Parapedobacter deserti]|uniref:Polyketide cyclase / dehydrase and lipid transport n=1 Tax=Parapedobacter deserti TaxID=1912957 RepID=A0ABV7JPE8_9SPHI
MDKNNISTYAVKHISISINKPADEVYSYASNPENWPAWTNFIQSVVKENSTWFAVSDLGRIKVEFVPDNNFGIIDHWVTLTDGTIVYNPMRVIENNQGSEFVFTLFRMPYMTEEAFEQDATAVMNDLKTLKKILEKNSRTT